MGEPWWVHTINWQVCFYVVAIDASKKSVFPLTFLLFLFLLFGSAHSGDYRSL